MTFSKLDQPEILSALFHRRAESKPPLPAGSIDVDIDVSEGGPTLGCRLHYATHQAPLIIYFHGNGETVSDYDDIATFFKAVGLNIMVASYRGYGWSGGEPTVSALFHDNCVVLDFFRAFCQEHQFTGPIFVMGRSLGAASAIDLAFKFPDSIKGLIIDSGFANTLPLAARLGYDISKVDIKEEDCFNNLPKIRAITIPTLILHGANDQLIPVAEAEKLQAESGAKAKQFSIIPGANHNSLIEVAGALYFETIKTFIDTATGQNTWRQRRKQFKQKG